MLRMTFHGAAGGVTGSKHLLDTGKIRILLDCGMFQGPPEAQAKNRDFAFDPKTVDAVVLSHAHADHSGQLPLLVKRGFRGPIYATRPTRDIAEQILLDAAHIAENDAIGEPLFTRKDIPAVVERFVEVPYVRRNGGWHDIGTGVRLKFYDAGHILGSAVPVLEVAGPRPHRIAFSGDLGAPGMPLLYDPDVPDDPIDTVLVESTYGDTVHPSFGEAVARFAATVRAVAQRKGKLIVPAFSLGRTQLLVYLLHKLRLAGEIPAIPVYVDSPLATTITEIFERHRREYDDHTWSDFSGPQDSPLAYPNLTYTRSGEESQAINRLHGPLIIISASGMMTGGRVVHHLRHTIVDPRNAILVVGYQAEGTTGRAILDGAKEVKLRDGMYPVRAEVIAFDEFSAHADRDQLLSWLGQFQGLRHAIVVHGEVAAADALRDAIAAAHPDWRVDRPNEGDVIELR
ncbi:MBL fold metallo-hydrolase [Candidatus Uhrbacteria bacterium]|nr:MBL fold metallo-hydrolase [Candidatus Uhrbacteria bacterium]